MDMGRQDELPTMVKRLPYRVPRAIGRVKAEGAFRYRYSARQRHPPGLCLISYGTGWQPEADNANAVMAEVICSTRYRSDRTGSPANATWVSWQVIECLGQEFQVYRGSGSLGNDQLAVDAPLNGSQPRVGQRTSGPVLPDVKVDPARCIAYVTANTSAANRTYYHEALLTAYVNAPTTVRIDRAAAGHSTINYNWVVVEFAAAAVAGVQHGSVNFVAPTDTAPASRKIVPVNRGSSILLCQTRSTSKRPVLRRGRRTFDSNTRWNSTSTRNTGRPSVPWSTSARRVGQRKIDQSGDAAGFARCHLTQPSMTGPGLPQSDLQRRGASAETLLHSRVHQ
jgi:hypothetical protein